MGADPRRTAFAHPTLRIDHLTNTALARLERTAGVDDEHGRAYLRMRLGNLIAMVDRGGSVGAASSPCCAGSGAAPTSARRTLARVIRGAYERRPTTTAARRAPRPGGLRRVLRHLRQRFDRDPQFPWAAEALSAEGGAGTAAGQRLYHAGLAWLAQLLSPSRR